MLKLSGSLHKGQDVHCHRTRADVILIQGPCVPGKETQCPALPSLGQAPLPCASLFSLDTGHTPRTRLQGMVRISSGSTGHLLP